MSKKAVLILSSPRKGSNSSALALALAEGLKEGGVRVETVDLSGLNIGPCLSCGACRRNGGKCAQMDGMQTVYPQLAAADILVLASPVYWFNMSGQLKIFLDRCYAVALSEEASLAGKTLAAALAYGDEDPLAAGAVNAVRCLQDICRYTGARWGGCVYGSGLERNALAGNLALLDKARELGRQLL
jgi:multimeric flavodoxin WrbA